MKSFVGVGAERERRCCCCLTEDMSQRLGQVTQAYNVEMLRQCVTVSMGDNFGTGCLSNRAILGEIRSAGRRRSGSPRRGCAGRHSAEELDARSLAPCLRQDLDDATPGVDPFRTPSIFSYAKARW